MKHLQFKTKELPEGDFEIRDQHGKLWATTTHPVFTDLVVEMLNEEFERVTLQTKDAKDKSKEIASE